MTPSKRDDGRLEANRSSFDEVLARYQAEVYGFAVHLTRDRAEARDLYGKTLLRAFHAFDERAQPASYRSWLLMIATEIALSDDRRYGPRGSPRAEQAVDDRGKSLVQADRFDADTLHQAVEAFVVTLPRQQWVAFVQRAFLNLAYAEIAETLRCSEVEARTNVYAALRTMRAHFGDRL